MASASTSASSLTAPVSTSDQDNKAMVALKARFYNEICAELKPKVNVIETRAIYRHQVVEIFLTYSEEYQAKRNRQSFMAWLLSLSAPNTTIAGCRSTWWTCRACQVGP